MSSFEAPSRWRQLLTWLDGEIAVLNPGCFAIVMATGIISNAMFFFDHRAIADALFAVNAVVFAWLALATLARLVRFRAALWADLTNAVAAERSGTWMVKRYVPGTH